MRKRKVERIPLLSDNAYRLLGVGSATPLPEVRQLVRRAETSARVGILEEPPLSDVLEGLESDVLGQHLRSVLNDPLKRTCHRLMWFLDIPTTGKITYTVLEQLKQEKDEVSRVQSEYLISFLHFVLTQTPNTLEKTLTLYSDFLKNPEVFDRLTTMLVNEAKDLTTDKAKAVVQQAQREVALAILTFATEVSVRFLRQDEIEPGEKIIKTIIHSPLADDWENTAMSPLTAHLSTLVEQIEQVHRNFRGWNPGYKNPIEGEANLLLRLADLLKGRISQAHRWRQAVIDWGDALAVSMSNYAVAQINDLSDRFVVSVFGFSDRTTLIQELHERLLSAQTILESALKMKVSPEVKQHLEKVLQDTKRLLADVRPRVAQEKPAPQIRSTSHSTPSTRTKSNTSSSTYCSTEQGDFQSQRAAASPYQTTNKPYQESNSRNLDSALNTIVLLIMSTPVLILCLFILLHFLPNCSLNNSYTESASYNESGLAKAINFDSVRQKFRSGKYSEAVSAYLSEVQKAKSMNYPIPASARFYYAESLLKLGKRKNALAAYETCLVSEPNGSFASQCVDYLHRYGVIQRPKTGAKINFRGIYTGTASMTLENTSKLDAVVRYTRLDYGNKSTIRSLYIRSGSRFKSLSLPSGEYILEVNFGKNWHKQKQEFLTERYNWTSEPIFIDEYSDHLLQISEQF